MTEAELGMELYVVAGNALHLLLRGMPAEARAGSGVDMQLLERLDRMLSPIAPAAMLTAVRALDPAERAELQKCMLFCAAHAGAETETVLGAPESLVQELSAGFGMTSGV